FGDFCDVPDAEKTGVHLAADPVDLRLFQVFHTPSEISEGNLIQDITTQMGKLKLKNRLRHCLVSFLLVDGEKGRFPVGMRQRTISKHVCTIGALAGACKSEF
ncbi:hypothetical protein HY994_06625, partial [Candidatus Micrarchaeota archaeon]|nr:hypothetical protein [Candidatus Micrarchaeota archaeon]